jgi:sirohydrochlorin cobaltochelatase
MNALILFAHGSRRDSWRQPFDNLLAKMKKINANMLVELAFLEIMQPALDITIIKLIDMGCTDITICPIFLGKGGHIERDLVNIINNTKNKYSEIKNINNICIKLLPTIGERDEVLEFIANDIFRQL